MKKLSHLFFLALALVLSFASCKDEDEDAFSYYSYEKQDYALLSQYLNLPELPYAYNLTGSAFIQPPNIDNNKATLGRVLFYDTKLSKDGKISCASCHKQEYAFADNRDVSLGVYDRAGDRNSIALFSVGSFASEYGDGGTSFVGSRGRRFFWDNRAPTAADQSKGSMTNPKEMDMSMEEITEAVKKSPFYEPLFRKAFGNSFITSERILESVAEFVNAMGSTNSRFDQGINLMAQQGRSIFANDPIPNFTESENNGQRLYANNCSSCHSITMSNLPVDHASNGLDVNPTDKGVGDVTGSSQDMGSFKVPALRNIAVTAPYMHDGRFKTLEEVVDFYSSGIQNHANLHQNLRNNADAPKRFNFTEKEKGDLIAFLKTLTDETALKEARFSNPFK